MQPGSKQLALGILRSKEVRIRRNGPPFVKGLLERPKKTTITVVWWDADQAPAVGERIQVQGTVHQSPAGEYELYVDETRSKAAPTSREMLHPHHRLLGYLISCVEAEASQEVLLDPDASTYTRLEDGRAPAFCTYESGVGPPPLSTTTHRWCTEVHEEGDDSVLVGYPIVHGFREDNGKWQPRLSPLCLAECDLLEDGGQLTLRRKDPSSEEINPFALDLLGLSRDERETLSELLDASTESAEAASPTERVSARIQVLLSQEVVNTVPQLDPARLSGIPTQVPNERGIANAAVIMRVGRSLTVRALVEDLQQLSRVPGTELERGPLGAFILGSVSEPHQGLLPFPTLQPSNFSQDQAVTCAMKGEITVVTGPPGTGKSQTLVNAIAAAVHNNQTVIFSSKNNQAVDVVVARLDAACPEIHPIRTGNQFYRKDAVQRILSALNAIGVAPSGLPDVSERWDELALKIRALQEKHDARNKLLATSREKEAQISALRDSLPSGLTSCFNQEAARCMVNAANGGTTLVVPWWRRWVRPLAHSWERKRLAACVASVSTATPSSAASMLPHAPELGRSGLPPSSVEIREWLSLMVEIGTKILQTLITEDEFRTCQAELAKLPIGELEVRLADLDHERVKVGRELLQAEWKHRSERVPPQARTTASLVAQNLAGSGLKQSLKHLLPLLPVWSVTNLSARRSFPLEAGLFDLLIVDEASQSDIASIVPLLFRAKRALIIGDPNQLTHITCLRDQREAREAREWLLTDAQNAEWNYLKSNAFEISRRRISKTPILLDQHFRSHPAIIQFCNEQLYNNELVVCTDPTRWHGRPGLKWVQVGGKVESSGDGSRFNDAEAKRVVEELLFLQSQTGVSAEEIGVVSPYRAQADRLADLVGREKRLSGTRIGTAHRFQGDEREVMVYSPVISGHVASQRGLLAFRRQLVNVAISRARRLLVVVGDLSACKASTSILANFADYYLRLVDRGSFSPFEEMIFNELSTRGLPVALGQHYGPHRLAISIDGRTRLNVECDGHPFNCGWSPDPPRDAALREAGWQVMRLAPREIARDRDGCVERILVGLEGTSNRNVPAEGLDRAGV